MRTRTLAAPRPANVPWGASLFQGWDLKQGDPIPATWIILTAPRPLFGHALWRDGGGAGFFWSAVNPDDADNADWMMKGNAQNDATQVTYITEDEAIDSQRAYYIEYYSESRGVDWINEYVDNPANRDKLVEAAVRRLNKDA